MRPTVTAVAWSDRLSVGLNSQPRAVLKRLNRSNPAVWGVWIQWAKDPCIRMVPGSHAGKGQFEGSKSRLK